LTREERRAQKKQAKTKASGAGDNEDEDSDEPLEVNANRAGVKAMKLSEVGAGQPSRREKYVIPLYLILSSKPLTPVQYYREAKEKKEAQERYWKLHEQGKTDQAKTDLARLAKIRAEREAAAAKRKAETEGRQPVPLICISHSLTFSIAKAAEVEAKKQAQMSGRRS
jgi:hypothetical protein